MKRPASWKRSAPGIPSLQPGDHVVSCWQAPCGKCERLYGNTHICDNLIQDLGTGKLLDGTARFKDAQGEVVNHTLYVSGFSRCIVAGSRGGKSTPELPLDQACLLGCVGTGWGAVHRSGSGQGRGIRGAWGMGGVGLNIVQGARLAGTNAVENLEGSKEAIAREIGAAHFITAVRAYPLFGKS